MTRDNARELAVQIIFGATHAGIEAFEYIDSFFSEEYYKSLMAENEVFQELPGTKEMEYIRDVATGTFEHLDDIDARICASAHGWALNRISGTALAVMRAAVYEIFYREDVPAASAINSAVEISKGYDEADTVAFINGVLGGILRAENRDIAVTNEVGEESEAISYGASEPEVSFSVEVSSME